MNTIEIIQTAWPDWRIVDDEPLGVGSFGCVYRAERRDITGVTQAAIKIISIPKDKAELNALRREGMSFEETRTYLEKMVRSVGAEIRLMEQVKGFTNIVSIEDYKVIEHPEIPQWQILMRMELLKPLPEVMSESEIIQLGKDICSALAICRKKNIVHRDIKPENIFINSAGFYKLGDFGVARTMEHMTVGFTRTGTYNYMAPEIFNNAIQSADIDAAVKVDIYSLGMVLYTLCNNGRIPFVPTDAPIDPDIRMQAIARRMKGEALPAPKYASTGLATVIGKACAFDPRERYASAEAFRDALEHIGLNNQTTWDQEKTIAPTLKSASARETFDYAETVRIEPGVIPKPQAAEAIYNRQESSGAEGHVTNQYKHAEPISDPRPQEAVWQNTPPYTALSKEMPAIEEPVIKKKTITRIPKPALQTNELSDSWEEIIAAIDEGTAKQRYAIGATKELDLGRLGTVHMRLAGFNLDERADGQGKAATTWIAVELLPEGRQMNRRPTNEGGWRDSDLRNYLRNTVLPSIPSPIRPHLVKVVKRQLQWANYGHQTTVDTVWIPDSDEVKGNKALYYDLFLDTNQYRMKSRENSVTTWWWLRSAANNYGFRYVSSDGSCYYNAANDRGGVALGFCL